MLNYQRINHPALGSFTACPRSPPNCQLHQLRLDASRFPRLECARPLLAYSQHRRRGPAGHGLELKMVFLKVDILVIIHILSLYKHASYTVDIEPWNSCNQEESVWQLTPSQFMCVFPNLFFGAVCWDDDRQWHWTVWSPVETGPGLGLLFCLWGSFHRNA